MNITRKNQYWLFFAFTLAVLLRVGLLAIAFTHPDRVLETDSGSYLTPAQYMLQDGYYSYPDGMRMPLYPAFLALLMKVFGSNLLPVIIVQILLGLGTVVLTWRTGLLLGLGPCPSAIGAVLLSLSLESILSPYYILTDTFFTFLLVAATYALVRFIKLGGWTWLVSASLLNGLVTLCRPVLALGAVSILLLLFFNTSRARMLQRVGHASLFALLLVALFIAPWTYRNTKVVGVKTLTTEMGLYWSWSAAMINADLQGITLDQAKSAVDNNINQLLAERGLQANDKNLYNLRTELGEKTITEHPVLFFYLVLRYDLRSFLPGMGYAVKYLGLSQGNTEGLELLQSGGIQQVINNYFGGKALSSLIFFPFLILLAFVYVGAILGVIILIKKREWLSLMVLLLPPGYMLLITSYNGNSRYRIPAMPFIALLAGVGLVVIWQFLAPRLARKRKPVK